jgi:hypothetical protein
MSTQTADAPVSGARALFRADAPARPLVTDARARIYLLSFTLLFFELLCIRWIPSYVRYLSYFNNFLLLASFLGMGLGILAARRPRFWFPPFPVMALLLTVVVAFNRFDLRISSTTALFYGLGEAQGAQSENFIVLPIIFGLMAACFIPLARPLGGLLSQVRPLTAYTFDILGSLSGTAAFFLIAYFSLPPVVWFAALAALVIALSDRRLIPLAAVAMLACAGVAWQLQQDTYWSPYYKIVLHKAEPRGWIVDVNNAGGHQLMAPWQDKEPFYRRVYDIFPGPSFPHALILGAGSGSDVATALAKGVPDVTGVEIDPKIAALGAEFHPDQPYSDPRVHVVIDDGRAYLRNTQAKYDLIIFALPDSLTLTSNMTSLRLESFLLTQEAIAAARARLTDNGLLVLYNYYRQGWFVDKLTGMTRNVFGQDPLVSTYGGWGRAAVIMAGPRLASLAPGRFGPYQEAPDAASVTDLRVIGEGYYHPAPRQPATDDWPFIYLEDKSFPSIYIAGLAMVAIMSLVGVLAIAPRGTLRRFDWHMFFLGVAFAVLEVKALITFALLFGSTWMVNSMVFFAILVGVLLAVLVNARFRIRHIGVFYALLFGMLLLNLIVQPESLLFSNAALRYLVASFLAFAPVFLANVIFSNSFRDTEAADVAFASNLLGIMTGGMLEYFSMLFGYHLLLIPVIVFYAIAMLLRRRGAGAGLEAAPAPAT